LAQILSVRIVSHRLSHWKVSVEVHGTQVPWGLLEICHVIHCGSIDPVDVLARLQLSRAA